MGKKISFPRNVYKKDGPIKWNRGITYSTEYVTDKTEYEAALKAGYLDDFNEALLGDAHTVTGSFEEVTEEKKEVKKSIFNKKPVVKEETSDDDF